MPASPSAATPARARRRSPSASPRRPRPTARSSPGWTSPAPSTRSRPSPAASGLDWLVVLTPDTLDEGLSIAGALLAGRSVDLLVIDLPPRPDPGTTAAKVADRLRRLAALARRSETLLVALEPPGLAAGLATAVAESTGLRLELARRSWIRLGRDVVGQQAEVTVARNRFGPPGRRAELRILYAEGGERDSASAARTSSTTLPPPPALSTRSRPMRLLHLYWPHLPLRLARARRSDSFPTDRPVVLGGQPWTDGTVIDADPAARALGVRRGIPLGSAHRLAPEAAFLDPEPDEDAASVEAAFGILARFSPGLAGVSDQADPAFGLLEVQVDGLERLWGSEPEIVGAARRGARRQPAGLAPAGDRRDPVRGDGRRRQRRRRPSRGSSGPAARPRSSARCRRRC